VAPTETSVSFQPGLNRCRWQPLARWHAVRAPSQSCRWSGTIGLARSARRQARAFRRGCSRRLHLVPLGRLEARRTPWSRPARTRSTLGATTSAASVYEQPVSHNSPRGDVPGVRLHRPPWEFSRPSVVPPSERSFHAASPQRGSGALRSETRAARQQVDAVTRGQSASAVKPTRRVRRRASRPSGGRKPTPSSASRRGSSSQDHTDGAQRA